MGRGKSKKQSGRLTPYEPKTTSEIDDLHSGSVDELVKILEGFQPNESYQKRFDVKNGIGPMEQYVERLKYAGLDIGKGNAEYGFKMPLPEKDKSNRYLVIFRRR